MSRQMRHMMKAINKDGPIRPPRVELAINPRHAVIKRLAATHESAPARAALVAEQLLDDSLLAADLLDDPAKMVARLYKIMES
jgi:TNF receptor-associated protein 1